MESKVTGVEDDIWGLGGGVQKLPALFNAMKAVNPGMHYEYIPKPDETRNERHIFFWAF
jgi:hypothetical protein